jgi:ubiquinone/menaquinone biosynthesis C-methylase UbiE
VSGAAGIWEAGTYERIAVRFAPIHDELVSRLRPVRGERWLDLGTGTGEVALRAARAGAHVTALDISPKMLAAARAKAATEGVEIRFDEGDAQELPYADGSFDVVSSSFGVVFPPDQEAVARELGRVCRHGGRLGLTAWRPKPLLRALYARFQDEPSATDNTDWGREERLHELLDADFQLALSSGTWCLEGESAEAVYEFMAEAAPPMAIFLERLPPEREPELRAAFVEHWRRFADAEGRVREPRDYLLVIGTRR